MSDTAAELEAVIAALQAQRTALGDAAVETAIAPLRAKLAALRPTAAQRRLVTVLFLDVVGSTALSEALDPEDIQDIMDGALERFSRIVVQHQGKVLQYAGDSLLAAFGAELAREDDAERAVHAGLALLAEARVQAERVRREHHRAGFDVRVGLHTGSVLLGGGVDEDGTIRGFPVNIAARMEQAALPGSLRISQDTWRHVRGVFEVEAQPPLPVKGRDEPMHTYLVQRAKPRAFRVPSRGVEGVETRLIGRDADLMQLVRAFESTCATRALHAVTLVAEAGLGKSRLMHELQHHLEAHVQSCWLLLGRAQPVSSLQPYGLLRDVLAWRLQIADSASADAARRRLVEGLAPLLGEQGKLEAELLGQLIGMDFSLSPAVQDVLNAPLLLRDRAFTAFVGLVRRLAASDGSPVVMLLDDLQWADDASLDWLGHVLGSGDLPLLLVMATRPELLERHPAWVQGDAHLRVDLAPLAEAQRQALTGALLQRLPDIPRSLAHLIERHAEGNPFYAEELVKMLIDDGVIAVEPQGWRVVPGKLHEAHVPGTLTGVLQARLDALAAPERRALQFASVIGPVFWDAALGALDPGSPQALPALQRKAMVLPRPETTFEGTREQSFQHHLLHRVTYDTVLKAERRSGHARAAQWLAERVGDRQAEYLAITAEHYDRAGDKTRAIDWYVRAAEAARARYANAAARTYLERLLAMPELTDRRRRFALLMELKSLADLVGERTLQRDTLRQAEALAEQLDDDALRAEVLVGQALLADRLAEHGPVVTLSKRAAELAERSGASASASTAYALLAWRACESGDLAGATEYYEAGLRWARQAATARVRPDDGRYEINLLINSSNVYERTFDFNRRGQVLHQALHLATALRDRRVLCSCHEFLAALALDLLDAERAAQHIDEVAAIAQEIGLTVHSAAVFRWRALLELQQGRLQAAHALARQGASAFERVGARDWQALCLIHQAEAEVRGGAFSAARQLLQQAQELAAQLSLADDVRACRLLIADTWRAEGDLACALAAVQAELTAIDMIGALDRCHSPLPARMAAWRVLAAAADPRAARQLEIAQAELHLRTAKISDPDLRARVLEGVPVHREIVEAGRAQRARGDR